MKKLNEKGFTLIELLAVIIVLAVVMLIGVNSVLPLVEKSRKGAFESTASTVVETASTLYMADQLSGKKYKCIDLSYLINNGYLTKMSTGTSGYDGFVTISETSGKVNYTLYLRDNKNDYLISGVTKTNFEDGDVSSGSLTNTTCAAYDTATTTVTWTSGTDYPA